MDSANRQELSTSMISAIPFVTGITVYLWSAEACSAFERINSYAKVKTSVISLKHEIKLHIDCSLT